MDFYGLMWTVWTAWTAWTNKQVSVISKNKKNYATNALSNIQTTAIWPATGIYNGNSSLGKRKRN